VDTYSLEQEAPAMSKHRAPHAADFRQQIIDLVRVARQN
jgi:hypothetical protein